MERQFRLNWHALIEEAKQRRKTANLTQKRLAILANVSTPTVSRFEGGAKDIQLTSILNILKILGMLDERLLTFEHENEFYDPSKAVIVFFAFDEKKRIRCGISMEALQDHFENVVSVRDLMKVFKQHRKLIEHEVLNKYLANRLESDGSILIKTSDLS